MRTNKLEEFDISSQGRRPCRGPVDGLIPTKVGGRFGPPMACPKSVQISDAEVLVLGTAVWVAKRTEAAVQCVFEHFGGLDATTLRVRTILRLRTLSSARLPHFSYRKVERHIPRSRARVLPWEGTGMLRPECASIGSVPRPPSVGFKARKDKSNRLDTCIAGCGDGDSE